MKSLPASVVCMLIVLLVGSVAMADTPKKSIEHFDRNTGELYWDLDGEVRLKYIPYCRAVSSDSDTVHELMLKLDPFSILNEWDTPYIVSCEKRGLLVTYRLREDELFPGAYSKGIAINGKTLEYYSEYNSILKHHANSDNYQKIYAALQDQKLIVAAVYRDRYFEGIDPITGNRKNPEVEVIIDASSLDEADEVSANLAAIEAKQWNDKIYHGYLVVLFLDAALLSFLVFGFFLIRRWILRSSKTPFGKISTCKAGIKSITIDLLNIIKPKRSTIIKTDNLKSYSVADELLKWMQLKEAGIVSEEEFQEARKKIMSK